jgi:hypothetical protein
MSLDQTYHPATFYPVEGVDDVIPIEDGQQTVHGYYGVSRSRLNVLTRTDMLSLIWLKKSILFGGVRIDARARCASLYDQLKR